MAPYVEIAKGQKSQPFRWHFASPALFFLGGHKRQCDSSWDWLSGAEGARGCRTVASTIWGFPVFQDEIQRSPVPKRNKPPKELYTKPLAWQNQWRRLGLLCRNCVFPVP